MLLALLAVWALRRELHGLDAHGLMDALRAYGTRHVLLGIAATVASFALLGVMELVALRYARRADVPRRTGMATAFVANALSQAIGVALLTGAAVRLRAYRRYAMDASDVARISAFVTLGATLGLMATGAVAFLCSAAPLHLWRVTLPVHPVGALLGAVVLAALAWIVLGTRGSIGRGAWRITKPQPGMALAQAALASLDWVVTGSILYLALPSALAVSFATSLRVYLVAQTVGTLSHVPGGAGVFELLVLALLAPVVAPSLRAGVVAALVMFRALYYLLPLVAACVVSGVAELRGAHHRRGARVH